MNRLNELSFIDLYLGEEFAEIKGMKGASAYLTDLAMPLNSGTRATKFISARIKRNFPYAMTGAFTV